MEHLELQRVANNDPTLTRLELRYNQIGEEGARAIANALVKNSTLTTLDLTGNQIGNEGAKAIADALPLAKKSRLTTVFLRDNGIGDEGAKAIANALGQNSTLTTLHLFKNEIGDEGAIAIANALKKNSNLTNLNLSWNRIGSKGATAIAKALVKNSNLTTLGLMWNQIGNEGASDIAHALALNSTLTTLDLRANEIEDEGENAIQIAMNGNGMLTVLYLRDEKDQPKINKRLERNKAAHERARRAVFQILNISKTRHQLEFAKSNDEMTLALDALVKMTPSDMYRLLARYIWNTRGDPAWWTKEERKKYGVEEAAPSNTKRCRLVDACIHCNGQARWMEITAPHNRFCTEYCQFIFHHSLPDVRGMTPAQISKVLGR